MELIERDPFLAALQMHFEKAASEEGHCIFVTGEAGIGKTSLVKAFCKEQNGDCTFTRVPVMPCLLPVHWRRCTISYGR